jgi:DeoR/GlpR family transcriptional regulator of sugar metabolism
MLKMDSHAFILSQENLHSKVRLINFSLQTGISDNTIRKDFQQLGDEGKFMNVHVGPTFPAFRFGHHTSKEVYGYSQKKIIAQKAVSLIRDSMLVLTFEGSTIVEPARTYQVSSFSNNDCRQIKKSVIESARKLISLTFSEKINSPKSMQLFGN